MDLFCNIRQWLKDVKPQDRFVKYKCSLSVMVVQVSSDFTRGDDNVRFRGLMGNFETLQMRH